MESITQFDFVELSENPGRYYILKDLDIDGGAIIVGMDINVARDGIVFYSNNVNIKSLSKVSEYFVNIIGPLYKLRESMRCGRFNVVIEER